MKEQGGEGGRHENSSTKTPTAASLFTIRSALLAFLLSCCIRIFHATVMVHSYFDPDEFWQTMEPAYCLVFFHPQEQRIDDGEAKANASIHFTCPGFTWEWKRRAAPELGADLIQSSLWGPARTHLSVLPVYLFYLVLKYCSWDSTWIVERGPMILYAVTVAAPTDWTVWYIAHYLQMPPPPPPPPQLQQHADTDETSNAAMTTTIEHNSYCYYSLPAWCLFCSLSSWFNAYAMVRTFANAQETALFMFAVALVSPELLLHSTRSSKQVNQRSKGNDNNTDSKYEPAWCKSPDNTATSLCRACLAFWLGGLCVSIRSTAIAAFVPMGILLALHHSLSSPSSLSSSWQSWWHACYSFVMYLLFPCATFGLAGIVVAMCVDFYFFGFWTMPFLGNFHFNAVLDHAALFGSHPWHWYFLAGIPVVAGLWLPFLFVDIIDYWKRQLFAKRDGTTSRQHDVGRRNLSILASTYVLILSGNAHKEFRYILPVLPLFCLLAGERVRQWFLRRTGGGGGRGGGGGDGNVSSQRSVSAIHRGRIIMLGTIVVIIQLAVVAYLGRFHQSGSVSVNRRIVQHVLHDQNALYFDHVNDMSSFSIHYLTGACHSTPLLSQLHIPINKSLLTSSSKVTKQQQQQHIRFDTWSLDCSPDCRADPNAICEYQRFDLDPVKFINDAYGSSHQHRLEEGGTEDVCENKSSDKDTMTCKIEQQQQHQRQQAQERTGILIPPDYLVTTSSYVNRIGLDLLHAYGLDKLDQFPQRLQGIRLSGRDTLFDEPGNSFSSSSLNSIYTLKLPLGQNQYITLLEVSVEDMIVLHQTKQQKVET